MPTLPDRNFIVFTSGLFRDEQPDEELDQWFLGEDCAQWLEARLLSLDGVSRGVAPLEEDWHGWTFGIRAHGIWFWIKIWCWAPRTWVVGVDAKPGLLGIFRRDRAKRARAKLCDELDSILAAATEIESHEWQEFHPADLPQLVVTDPSKFHVASAPTFEPRSWQWRLHVPKQAKLRLFIASDGIPAHGFPINFRASELPSGEFTVNAEICQGRLGQWKIRANYPSGVSGLEMSENHSAWVVEPHGYSEWQAGLKGSELAISGEPMVLLRLRAMQRAGDRSSSSVQEPCDGVMIWIAEEKHVP